MKIKTAWVFVFGLHFILFSACFAQTAYLEPEEIMQGDTTTLVIEFDGESISPAKMDSSVLKRDFEIINNTSSMNVIQEEGTVTTRMRWVFELLPLKTGQIEIPPMAVNGSSTPKLLLKVNPSTATADTQSPGQNVYLEVSADTLAPYIGQQVNVTLRLYHKVRIVHGTLSQPEVEGADVYRIGKDISYTQTVSGEKYSVLERSFALFANAEGPLWITPIEFRGQIEASASVSNSYSDIIQSTQRINRQSKALQLDIKGIPAAFTGKYWLPASNLRLSANWPDEKNGLEMGSSTSVGIKMIADGLPAEALPDSLLESAIPGINVYPDKARRITRDIGKKLIGTLNQQYELIVSSAGKLEVPAITVSWWNVDEDREMQTVIDPHTLEVEAGNSTESGLLETGQSTTKSELQAGNGSVDSSFLTGSVTSWRWLALAFLLLWLLTIVAWLMSRSKHLTTLKDQSVVTKYNTRALQQACHGNNALKARTELMLWARKKWPDQVISGLNQIKGRVKYPEFVCRLEELDCALYGNSDVQWKGQALWQAFKIEHQTSSVHQIKAEQGLPPLYPVDLRRNT